MGFASKKPVRATGVVLSVLVLAVVLVKVFLPTEKIRDLALDQARSRLGREVSVGEVSVSLLGGLGVRLADFAVHNPPGFEGGHLISTQALDLKLEIAPLLKGEVRVDRLVVEGPTLNLVRQADGSDNFSFSTATDVREQSSAGNAGSTPSDTSSKAPPPLSVASLNLQDGKVTFSDGTKIGTGIQQVDLSGLDLGLTLVDLAPGRFRSTGELSVAQVTVTGPAELPELKIGSDFDLVWDTATSRLDLKSLSLVCNDLLLTANGFLETGQAIPTGQIRIQAADLPLTGLLDFLPADKAAKISADQGAGLAHTTMDLVLGEDEIVAVKGSFSAEGIVLTELQIPVLNTSATFDLFWHSPESRLEINSLDGKINGLPVRSSGQVFTGGPAPAGQVQVEASDLPLAKLAEFLPPDLGVKIDGTGDSGLVSALVDLVLTGAEGEQPHSKGKVTVSGLDLSLAQPLLPPSQKGTLAGLCDLTMDYVDNTGDPAQITYTGHLSARGVSFTESGLIDELEDLDAQLNFTQDKFTVESCQARFASGSLELTGTLNDPFPYFLPPEMQGSSPMKTPHLDFELYSPRLDVDRLLPSASPATATAESGGGKPSQPRAAVPVDMEFPALSCDGSFRADSLIYMQVPLTEVTGKIKLRDRQFSVFGVKGAVYQGSVEGRVDIDLNDMNDPVYKGEYQAHDIEVDNFATRFAGLAGVVFGGCNLSGGFAARGIDPVSIRNSLTLDAKAGISQGKVVTSGNLHSVLDNLAQKAGGSLDKEQALKDLATHISIESGRVTMNELTTRLGQFGDITVDGYYGFDGAIDYNGRILLTRFQTDQLFTGSSLLQEVGKLLGSERPDRLELPLTLSGTRQSPSLKLDLGSVTSDLQERALKAQGRKLEDKAKSKLKDLFNKLK